jgi:hypothetical protein
LNYNVEAWQAVGSHGAKVESRDLSTNGDNVHAIFHENQYHRGHHRPAYGMQRNLGASTGQSSICSGYQSSICSGYQSSICSGYQTSICSGYQTSICSGYQACCSGCQTGTGS